MSRTINGSTYSITSTTTQTHSANEKNARFLDGAWSLSSGAWFRSGAVPLKSRGLSRSPSTAAAKGEVVAASSSSVLLMLSHCILLRLTKKINIPLFCKENAMQSF
mmetsp:Transcript_29627/g.48887  ORF Transcript_29627/g.48887 Transcript_29627/m.48887 type:complete len:106 (-) Transcript_29627:211-528(-)